MRRRWVPQISLRMFLLAWLVLGGGVAWVSHSYYEYQVEQAVIAELTKTAPAGTVAVVSGKRKQVGAGPFFL